MWISRQNRQLLFTVLLAAVLAMAVGYLIEGGVGIVGERGRVMELAEDLAKCTTQEAYLDLVRRSFPEDSAIWQSPAMSDPSSTVTAPATLEQLGDGRLRVAVVAVTEDELVGGLIQSNSHVYLPAALVNEAGRGYRLEDLRLNSRTTQVPLTDADREAGRGRSRSQRTRQRIDLVFEYYYGLPAETETPPGRHFRFFLGRRQWDLEPVAAPRRR